MYKELANYSEFNTHDNISMIEIDAFKFNNKSVRLHDRIKIISSNGGSTFTS